MIIEITLPAAVGERTETNDIKELETYLDHHNVPFSKVRLTSRRLLSVRWSKGRSVSYGDLSRVVEGVQLHIGEIDGTPADSVEVNEWDY